MRMFKRVMASRPIQQTFGMLAAGYLGLVYKTSRVVIEPPDIYDKMRPQLPVIIAMWHGQHFMMPFFRRAEHKVTVLISRHRDGEVNAIAAQRLGLHTIRGSGAPDGRFDRKGGVVAFRAMLDALADGCVVAMTADVPKIARVAGMGIVTLARYSGRPIVPVAVATSRRIELDNWDRSEVNLPFSRFAMVAGDAIHIAADATEDAVERARQAVEMELNAVTARAHALVDRHDKR
jgi:lysophospholipid acyltransferase (LPLAT)-like uncharacterized protein